MADCPSCQVNGLIGLTSCGAWLVIVGVGVAIIVEVKDTVRDGVTIVGLTNVIVGVNSDVSVGVMLLVTSTCVVAVVTVDVASVVIGVVSTSLVTFGINTCEDNIISVVLTMISVVDDVGVLVTDGVMELVSVKLGEGETSSLVFAVVTLGDIVTILDTFAGVGVMTTVPLDGTISVIFMTLVNTLLLVVMGDIVILGVSVSVRVITVGDTTSLVIMLLKIKLEVVTILAEGDILVTTVLLLITSLIDGDTKLIVVMSGSVVVTTSLVLTTGRVLRDITLGEGVILGSIVEGRVSSLELIMLVVKVTDKVMAELTSGCIVTSLVLTTDGILGEITLGVGIIVVAGRVMVTLSLVLIANDILGEITLGDGIILVKGGVMVTFSLVLITSLNVVTGIIVVLTSGCVVVRVTSLEAADGSIETLDTFKITLGVMVLVMSGDGEKEDTSSIVVSMLLTALITLVTGDGVKLSVSINDSVVVGEIMSLVTSLVMMVTANVGVTGRVKIVPDTSAMLVKVLSVTIRLGTDDVIILEISSDGNVVKDGGSNDDDVDSIKLGLTGI